MQSQWPQWKGEDITVCAGRQSQDSGKGKTLLSVLDDRARTAERGRHYCLCWTTEPGQWKGEDITVCAGRQSQDNHCHVQCVLFGLRFIVLVSFSLFFFFFEGGGSVCVCVCVCVCVHVLCVCVCA